MAKNSGKAKLPGFEFWIGHLLAMQIWADDFTS